MSRSLKSKTLHGLFWSFFELTGQQGIQFVVMIILARLLLPEQFGLIAMLAIFMAIGQMFIESGFGQALIQKKDTTHIDECSVFYLNILVGFLAASLLCIIAPWIAGFYNQPLLTPLTRALSLNLVISSFGLVQITLLTRRVDFKTQMKVSMIATILSGTIGVTMALKGFGVWSLVAQSLSSNLVRTILLWFFNTWRPSLVFSPGALREMFGFSSRLLAIGFLDTIFQNIYLIVIGKFFSASDLGFYAYAKRLQHLPLQNMSSIIGRVTFPIFSSIQDDKARLKRGMRKQLATISLINFPMMIGLAVVAKPLVMGLLGEKWAPSIPYLQLLCVVGLLYPLHAINLNMLKAQGRSDLFLRLAVISHTLQIVALVITLPWGIEGILWGCIVLSFTGYGINTWYTARMIHYSLREQIQDILPYLLVAGAMGSIVCALQYLTIPWIELLLLQVAVGLAVYLLLCILFRPSAFVEGWALFSGFFFPGKSIQPKSGGDGSC